MKFCVIIVNYNGVSKTLDAMSSCLAEGVLAQHCIVIDNGSDDGS
ncbi:glycosyltransferase family 2 protein, partial [Acidithiobacillus ferrooxidans]|nr:glycosyltransferase family 2 protein [Acidithiobacillus ferrooxidans]